MDLASKGSTSAAILYNINNTCMVFDYIVTPGNNNGQAVGAAVNF